MKSLIPVILTLAWSLQACGPESPKFANRDPIAEKEIPKAPSPEDSLADLIAKAENGTTCHTKYPLLLVHGVALRDKVLGIQYFGRIPDYLRKYCGIEVFEGGQDAFSISAVNADQLLTKLLEITEKLGHEKVNIIAHSKGGIDVRFLFHQQKGVLINGRTVADRVASFTTLSSPHRGSALADVLLPRFGPPVQEIVGFFLDIFGFLQGDSKDSDSKEALTMLSSASMKEWNDKFADLDEGIDGVYCQSWASDITGSIGDKVLQTTASLLHIEGWPVNDGAVQESSAKYARFRGTVGKDLPGGVSHFAMTDRALLITKGDTPGFNALDFYAGILRELQGMGF